MRDALHDPDHRAGAAADRCAADPSGGIAIIVIVLIVLLLAGRF
jgi:hypothetical protein